MTEAVLIFSQRPKASGREIFDSSPDPAEPDDLTSLYRRAFVD